MQNIDYADAQATRYEPGHFLTSHNDSVEGKNRLVAYVFNFTPGWHPDWGGNLMFYDEGAAIRSRLGSKVVDGKKVRILRKTGVEVGTTVPEKTKDAQKKTKKPAASTKKTEKAVKKATKEES